MNRSADWESLKSKFARLQSESAIEHGPSRKEPASKIVALRTVEPGSNTLGRWRLEYFDGMEDTSKIQRLEWLCCEGAALLGFRGENGRAVQY